MYSTLQPGFQVNKQKIQLATHNTPQHFTGVKSNLLIQAVE